MSLSQRPSAEMRQLAERCRQLEETCAAQERELNTYRLGWPPGHFYSPVPSLDEVRQRDARLFGEPPASLAGIDLNLEGQRARLTRIAALYPEQPFAEAPDDRRRYGFENPNYSYGEAITLFAMLHDLRPKRLIEIGSGHSSCAILDINELLGGSIACAFVEPYPELLLSLLRPGDVGSARVLATPVQDVDMAEFEALEEGDVLFVDSSHVAKVGSDVNHIVHEVFPRLARGVVVHIHDMFYPFEYPAAWVYQGRFWNECYLVRSFLEHNSAFRIEFFNDYWARRHWDELVRDMPLFARSPGSSLWLTKIA